MKKLSERIAAINDLRERAVAALAWFRRAVFKDEIKSAWSTEMEALAASVSVFDALAREAESWPTLEALTPELLNAAIQVGQAKLLLDMAKSCGYVGSREDQDKAQAEYDSRVKILEEACAKMKRS